LAVEPVSRSAWLSASFSAARSWPASASARASAHADSEVGAACQRMVRLGGLARRVDVVGVADQRPDPAIAGLQSARLQRAHPAQVCHGRRNPVELQGRACGQRVRLDGARIAADPAFGREQREARLLCIGGQPCRPLQHIGSRAARGNFRIAPGGQRQVVSRGCDFSDNDVGEIALPRRRRTLGGAGAADEADHRGGGRDSCEDRD
jgi:hypothetical protein